MTATTVLRTEAPAVQSFHANPLDVLGTDVSGAESYTDVLKSAGLAGWNVHLVPLQTASEVLEATGVTQYGPSLPVPDQYATVRTSPVTGLLEVIGVVGTKYTITQIEELEDFMLQAVELTGGQITKAGDYYGTGEQFFMTLDLPESTMVGGIDRVDHNITVFGSFDGNSSTRPVISSTRWMCQNQRNTAIRTGIESASIRHTASAPARLAQLQTLLKITVKRTAEHDAKAEQMIKAKLEDATFWEMVSNIYTAPLTTASQRSQTMHANHLAGIAAAYNGPESAGVRGTAWGAYNAITSHAQHGRNGKDAATVNARAAMGSATTQNVVEAAEKILFEYALQNA